MSNHVTSLLRRRRLGVGLTGKALILLMGDLASDDGSGIWASKPTMASELETSERTVQRTIKDLIDAGFVSEVGKRKHRNGYTYEYRIIVERIELCEDLRPVPPTQRHHSAQDVGQGTQHLAPDTVSPLTECHPTPDTVSGEPPTECHPNQNKPNRTYCAADAPQQTGFDFGGFFGEFVSAYPRIGDLEATEESLREALGAGADPREILAGARAYAVEQVGNSPRYIKYSENWVDEKRWRQHVTAPLASADPRKVLETRAQDIRARKPWARTIKPSQAGECIAAGLITAAECEAAGIHV
ncbi:helix-turn-helix domain-containing protein [Leisingera sp. ANG-M1]|uniref:helix-turn-helix domain-containing protein n=1 Tax=Leisingera sp. ANG-M1 TaxID=1577895 RepID=UPI00068B64A9|nr:helix-turn-helix domain-containing protein [Leisingera sp. ANG-M1]